ncbi:uncharacterized protein J4E79_007848 [Alternaria viburni]|uniref:uncharacterized protein n=1 Tax=Alternaria viburni TaxID=566460 RepID=UPI0020C41FEA|nr:uncharacterized protein J4E79_007848 [Alternaria viburni]KAI4657231.1 hypothetical protein J4E79_007848 [Alternaria viburni]
MPSHQEDKLFYIRAPSLDHLRNGPIKIGNIITDIFLPQDPIAHFEPLANIIDGASLSEGTRERGDHGSVGLNVSAKLYAAFGSQAKGKRSADTRTVYDFDNVDTLMLERNPRAAEMTALRDEDPEVHDALKRAPVYVITGLKIARGLKYSTIHSKESEVGLGAQGNVTKEVAVRANLDKNAGTDGTGSYTVLGDVIIAYRLHIFKKEGWRWRGEAALETRTYWPGNAGFLSREDAKPEVEVETESLSAQDLKYFVEDEGYGEIENIDVKDAEEEWSMMCVED